ncbi:MAG: hypothetical protein KJZ78_25525 [Bryobacteraceae bacterium]|nr:hypothetical protein [Bryobacteraceae bacterium]
MEQRRSIEIQFQLHAPSRRDTSDAAASSPPRDGGRLPRVTQVLALALQFDEMIRTGEVEDRADLARLAGVSRERISQIMKLTWLAPDIQIEVLHFPAISGVHFPIHERALRNISDVICWSEQRRLWSKLKQTNHLE